MPIDPVSVGATIDAAAQIQKSSILATIFDRMMGFKLSEWDAKREIHKKAMLDEYEKCKNNGIVGMQYIEYMRKTNNLVEVATKSTKYVDAEKDHQIEWDNDFFWNTLEYAKSVSNEDVQELLAKILAGEYNNPGSYSQTTLSVLKMLGKNEILEFEKICSLIINGTDIPTEVFSNNLDLSEELTRLQIDYRSLQLMQSIGLFMPGQGTGLIENTEKPYGVYYFDKLLLFESVNKKATSIKTEEHFSLSNAGMEIYKHLNPKFNPIYLKWLQTKYEKYSFKYLETVDN